MAIRSVKKVWNSLAVSLLLEGPTHATQLLNSSCDVSRELFAALNPPFEKQWAQDNDADKLTIRQSYTGHQNRRWPFCRA